MEQKTGASQAVKFRKKPVEIEAIQWTGKLSCLDAFNIPELHQSLGSKNVGIPTLEGTMIAHVGDWIIKGVKGKFYPCKPDIFELTYERAALKAQPAPTEAQGEPNKQVFENIEELRSAATAVVARWDSPKWKDEAPTADFIARLRKALQPSGNTGEFDLRQTQDGKVVQGWDVDDLISNMGIEKEVAKARAELQADPAIIPSLLAVQGEDSARLDALMHASWNLESFDMPTGGDDADIGWRVVEHHMAEPIRRIIAEVYDDNPREAIDRARASAETGGVKS